MRLLIGPAIFMMLATSVNAEDRQERDRGLLGLGWTEQDSARSRAVVRPKDNVRREPDGSWKMYEGQAKTGITAREQSDGSLRITRQPPGPFSEERRWK